MDPGKVQIVLDWQTPSSLRDVQCFLGFANFYQKFIENYSKIVVRLIQLTQKNGSFIWTIDTNEEFINLKYVFTSTPILAHVDLEKPFIIEADMSDFALGSVLS